MHEAPISVITVLGARLYGKAIGRFLEDMDHIVLLDERPLAPEHVETVGDRAPRVAVIEVSTHRLSTYEFLSALTRKRPAMAALALSKSRDPLAVDLAFRSGAQGAITTGADLQELISAIQTVARGKIYAPHGEAAPAPSPEHLSLTPREREVLQLTAEGQTSKEIGNALHISPRTVENYVRSLRRKFDVPNKAALVGRAYDWGLLP